MSKWIRDSLLDLVTLGIICGFVLTDQIILEIVLWIYSGLLLITKILALSVNFLASKASKTEVPDWFYHSVYAVSTILLFAFQYFYLGGVWLLIWILSFAYQQKKIKKVPRTN